MKKFITVLVLFVSFVANAQDTICNPDFSDMVFAPERKGVKFSDFRFGASYLHKDSALEVTSTNSAYIFVSSWSQFNSLLDGCSESKYSVIIEKMFFGQVIPTDVTIILDASAKSWDKKYGKYRYQLVKVVQESNHFNLTYVRATYREQSWVGVRKTETFDGTPGKFASMIYTGCDCPVGVFEFVVK